MPSIARKVMFAIRKNPDATSTDIANQTGATRAYVYVLKGRYGLPIKPAQIERPRDRWTKQYVRFDQGKPDHRRTIFDG